MLDVGQAEGAFVFGNFLFQIVYFRFQVIVFLAGLGFWFQEQFVYDKNTGHPYSTDASKYLIPTSKDIPLDFRVSLLKDNPNMANKMRSKFIGEYVFDLFRM